MTTMNQHNLNPQVVRDFDFSSYYPYVPLSDHRDAGYNISSKKTNKTNFYVIIVLAICLVLCCCVCVSLSVYKLSAFTVMEARLVSLEEKLATLTSKCGSEELSKEQTATVDSTTQSSTPKAILRKRRNATNHVGADFVHLVGINQQTFYATQVAGMSVFKWHKAQRRQPLHGFSLHPNPHDITTIRVSSRGVYLVYSQVAIHGRTHTNVHYDCSHITMHRSTSGTWSAILGSLLTQDKLGQQYNREQVNSDGSYKALDTQLQMGVFLLLANEELAVRIPEFCDNTNYTMTQENTYFGVVKIG